ncbi:hypothetical protein [Corynebacterium lubricantis]|nr:hypothetical protein [Corynebacterium lubricantis]
MTILYLFLVAVLLLSLNRAWKRDDHVAEVLDRELEIIEGQINRTQD